MWMCVVLILAVLVEGTVSLKCYHCLGSEATADESARQSGIDTYIKNDKNQADGCGLPTGEFEAKFAKAPDCSTLKAGDKSKVCYKSCSSGYVCTWGTMKFEKTDVFGTRMKGSVTGRGCEKVDVGCSHEFKHNPFFEAIVSLDTLHGGAKYHDKSVLGCACKDKDLCNGADFRSISLVVLTMAVMGGMLQWL